MAVASIALVAGCGGGSNLVVDKALLGRYHALAHPTVSVKASGEIDCYIDYSNGMGEGMRATAATNASLRNFLGGRAVTYYAVGHRDEPLRIDIDAPAANLLDLRNYREPGSKLKVAIDRMAAQPTKVSLFITDFERVEDVTLKQLLPGAPSPHPIDASAWAQTQFREWLNGGHRIDVFATAYDKPDHWFDKTRKATFRNWVYTIVFTPKAVLEDEAAFKASVVPFLLEAYAKVPGSRHFSYTANAFRLAQDGNATSGNANENLVVLEQFTDTFARGFEFYHVGSSDLMAFASDETQQDKRIINKLRVRAEVPFLSDVTYGLKVSDVTGPLTNLQDAATQAPEPGVTNPETGQVTGRKTPAPLAYEPGTARDGVFEFVYNPDTKGIGLKLARDFIGVEATTVYKVDVVVAGVTPREYPDADAVMALRYGNDYAITSLAESLRLAVRDVTARMAGTVLHTVYVRIDP